MNILITGANRGIGLEMVKFANELGWRVFACCRNPHNADSLFNLGKLSNGQISVHIADMMELSTLQALAYELRNDPIDVLMNNAGLGFGGAIEAFTSEQCLAQLDLNIVGTLRTSKAVLPGMRSRKSGLIIQISSIAGRGAFPGFGVYHASKWGLEGLSEAMRYELAPLGIDVVIVEPGPFSTNFFGNIVPASSEEIASAYSHVGEFFEGFGNQVKGMFEDANAPTDPMIVVKIFEDLINAPNGSRPLRTIAGLDFGFQALNDAVEPHRKASLASMGIESLDGPAA